MSTGVKTFIKYCIKHIIIIIIIWMPVGLERKNIIRGDARDPYSS